MLFCSHNDVAIDYKDAGLMKRFTAESGKITPEDLPVHAQNIKDN